MSFYKTRNVFSFLLSIFKNFLNEETAIIRKKRVYNGYQKVMQYGFKERKEVISLSLFSMLCLFFRNINLVKH